MRIDDETLAALGEGRLRSPEVTATLEQLTDEDKAALRDLFPIRHHLLFCEPGCGHPRVETQRPEGYCRFHAGQEQRAAMEAADAWQKRGRVVCLVPSRRHGFWQVYGLHERSQNPKPAPVPVVIPADVRAGSPVLDLSAYFAPGAVKAQIPDDLDIRGKDLRVKKRAVWTVSRDAEGKRWAELDTLCNPAVGTVEWAR